MFAIVDKHAPVCTKAFTSKLDCDYFTNALLATEQDLRRLEHMKACTGLIVHAQIYSEASLDYRHVRTRTKYQNFNNLIVKAANNQGELFKITNPLLQKSSNLSPSHESPKLQATMIKPQATMSTPS